MDKVKTMRGAKALAVLLLLGGTSSSALAETRSLRARDTWQDIGYARPSNGSSPILEVEGEPDRLIRASVTGGPPHGSMEIHIGTPGYVSAYGAVLVPAPDIVTLVQLDSTGAVSQQISLPMTYAPGDQVAIQGVEVTGVPYPYVTPSITNAWVHTALLRPKVVAHRKAADLASRLPAVSVVRATWAMSIRNTTDRDLAANLIVDNGALPDVDVPEGESIGSVPFDVGYVQEFFAPSSPEYAGYSSAVRALTEVGDAIVEVVWNASGVGNFSSFAVVRGSFVTFDSFMSHMAGDVYVVSFLGGLPECFTFGAEYSFGPVAAVGTARVFPVCDGDGNAVGCHPEPTSFSRPLWDVEVDTQCTLSGGSCICTGTIGITSGFKSASLKAGGGITISGPLGFSAVCSGTFQKSCP